MRALFGENLRHVVFADTRHRAASAIDFTPRPLNFPSEVVLSEDQDEDRRLLIWIFNQAGLNARHYRSTTLMRRLPALYRAVGANSVAQVKSAIQREPRLLEPALASLIIGVTSFFRDPHVFEILNRSVLPSLCDRRDGPRIWSVGCSDGAELYSLAIQLAERDCLARCNLLGTDCRPDAIVAAFAGRYDTAVLKGVSQSLLARYFHCGQRAAVVRGWMRTVPRWQVSNVLREVELGTWDIILCRNFAMYLQPEVARFLWRRLELALRPGGYLVVGRAEQPSGAGRLSLVDSGIFQRTKG
ncbi:MAG: hypothetical protein M3O30_10670 [Planctomycetota bacterium]|nr:hypothetical protein [Planctomycetota bacterium]